MGLKFAAGRLVGLGGSVAAALVLALALPEETCLPAVRALGYWVVLAAWLLLAVAGGRAWWQAGKAQREGKGKSGVGGQGDRLVGVILALVAGVVAGVETPRHRVQYDEALQMGTAWMMARSGEVAVPLEVRELAPGGETVVVEAWVDKRPWAYPVLVALVHDLTGYRTDNGFAVNLGIGLALMGTGWGLGRVLAGPAGGLVGGLWPACVPLVGQCVFSAGFEPLNLLLIQGMLLAGWWWGRNPGPERLDLLVWTAVLMAYARYETALLVGAVAAGIVGVGIREWRRGRRSGESRAGREALGEPAGWWGGTAGLAPLALVPLVWLRRGFGPVEDTFQLEFKAGAEAVFSWENLWANAGEAGAFFFHLGWEQPNFVALAWVGVPAMVGAAAGLIRRRGERDGGDDFLVAAGVGLAALTGLLLSYFWGQFTDPVTQRISLPTHLLPVLALLLAARWWGRERWLWAVGVLFLGGLVVQTVPTLRRDAPGERMVFARAENQKLAWVREGLEAGAVVYDLSPLPWILVGQEAQKISNWTGQPAACWRYIFQYERRERGQGWTVDPRYRVPGKVGEDWGGEPFREAELTPEVRLRFYRVPPG